MRLVLHIGSTKTGSSALQATLWRRRAALREAGILYPDAGAAAEAHHLLAAAIHPGAWRMHAESLPEDREAYFHRTATDIRTEAAANGAHTILISSEYLWGSLPADGYKAFARAFDGIPMEVLAFVRRQDEWASSAYMQAVKSGEPRDFGDWFEGVLKGHNSGLHYFRVINRWAYFLNAQAVHVLRYADTKANVFKATCEALGLQVETDVALPRVNPSPSANGVALLLETNRSPLSDDQKATARAKIMRAHRATGGKSEGRQPLISEAERDAILTLAAPSDALIERTFLRDGRPLFPRPPGPTSTEGRVPGEAPPADRPTPQMAPTAPPPTAVAEGGR